MNKNAAYTIVSKNYLGQALTIQKSFEKQENKDFDFKIFLMDMIQTEDDVKTVSDLRSQGVDISFWSEVSISLPEVNYVEMLFKYDVIEMNTAIKPYVMEHLYSLGYEKVIYFDPDIYFYQPISELSSLLDRYDIILTPHTTEPYPEDGKVPGSLTIMSAGIYNCGFIATKKSKNTEKMYKFWQAQLFGKCYVKQNEGLFTDQIWAEWFPSLFDNVYILKNKGYNGAYWNLHERLPEFKDGKWLMGGDLLVFYHFSGFNPNDYSNISKYQTRFTVKDLPKDYERFVDDYAKELLKNEFNKYRDKTYYYNHFYAENYLITKTKHRRIMCDYINDISANPFCCDKANKIKLYFKNGNLKALSLIVRFWRKNCIEKSNKNYKMFERLGLNFIGDIENEMTQSFVDLVYSLGIPYTFTDIIKSPNKVCSKKVENYKKFISTNSLFNINLIIAKPEMLSSALKTSSAKGPEKYNIAFIFDAKSEEILANKGNFECLDEIFVSDENVLKVLQENISGKIKVKLISSDLSDSLKDLKQFCVNKQNTQEEIYRILKKK